MKKIVPKIFPFQKTIMKKKSLNKRVLINGSGQKNESFEKL